jgi:hypothetical protein
MTTTFPTVGEALHDAALELCGMRTEWGRLGIAADLFGRKHSNYGKGARGRLPLSLSIVQSMLSAWPGPPIAIEVRADGFRWSAENRGDFPSGEALAAISRNR